MSTITSTQPSRALRPGISNAHDIPFPGNIKASGTAGVVLANNLVVTGLGATFFTDRNIQPGDIVYNTTNSLVATVVRVVNGTTLELSGNIFVSIGQGFSIYSPDVVPCLIYNGTANNTLTVITAGGDAQTFSNIPVGILPVRVRRITAGTLPGTIIALW